MAIFVTGGAGYIGSHVCLTLLEEGFDVVVIDNLCNSNITSLRRVEALTGKEIRFYRGDVSDKDLLERIFLENNVDTVIHLAGLKAVGESVAKPLLYYENNLIGTLSLVEIMEKHGVRNFIFSSSATVYGDPDRFPIEESFLKKPCTNPYSWTKSMQEEILSDICRADPKWNVILLRYFNPIGAHGSGEIGEDPIGIPNNLMPYITQVASGRLPELGIFGDDYETPDGTCIRDYIHVVDLAAGHVAAIRKVREKCGFKIYNLGTGHGYSVLEVVHAFERANGIKIPYSIKPRRAGDVAVLYCDPSKARNELGWETRLGIEDMCRDSWRWQVMNPYGYEGENE